LNGDADQRGFDPIGTPAKSSFSAGSDALAVSDLYISYPQKYIRPAQAKELCGVRFLRAKAGDAVDRTQFRKAAYTWSHVILGDSAGGIFRRVFHPGDRLVVDRDVLSCGPTLRCNDLGPWYEMRRAFWSSVAPGSALEPEAADFRLFGDSERLRKAERVTIWAATASTSNFSSRMSFIARNSVASTPPRSTLCNSRRCETATRACWARASSTSST
jgi:hypothetical protein